jgi:hypothetical protein
MTSRFSLVLMLGAALLIRAESSAADVPNFDPQALRIVTFKSFDHDYLGNKGYFAPDAPSPNDIKSAARHLKDIVYDRMPSMVPWLQILLPGIPNVGTWLSNTVEEEYRRREVKDFAKSVWGICVANGSNDPAGPDNLFLITDNEQGQLAYLDFAHKQNFELNGIIEAFLNIFDLNPNSIGLPSSGLFVYPKTSSGEMSPLSSGPISLCFSNWS